MEFECYNLSVSVIYTTPPNPQLFHRIIYKQYYLLHYNYYYRKIPSTKDSLIQFMIYLITFQ